MLGIALTDTFGTPAFLKAFTKPIPLVAAATDPSFQAPLDTERARQKTYAQVFAGVRQDSGSPAEFVGTMRKFYDSQGITTKKTVVFSDSLNVDLCLEYKKVAEDQGFQPTFGVGTYFTSKRVVPFCGFIR